MFVGALKLDLQILGSRSLKEKRMLLRRIKDRVRERFGLVVAEVGAQDLWQRTQLGMATASGDRGKLVELLDGASRCVAGTEGVELLSRWREVTAFAGQLETDDLAAGEVASGEVDLQSDEEAAGQGGARAGGKPRTPWTPPEWQRMLDEETR